jgi:hypothetical protein
VATELISRAPLSDLRSLPAYISPTAFADAVIDLLVPKPTAQTTPAGQTTATGQTTTGQTTLDTVRQSLQKIMSQDRAVVQDSFGALRDVRSRLGDLSKARLYLCEAVGHPADATNGRQDRRGARPGDRPGGGWPEELTSQFRVSHRWHVSGRIPLPPCH